MNKYLVPLVLLFMSACQVRHNSDSLRINTKLTELKLFGDEIKIMKYKLDNSSIIITIINMNS